MAPPRIILHAGFHKTGTTSVQVTLDRNRAALAGHVDIVLRDDILPLTTAARHYSKAPDDANLAAFGEIAESVFAAMQDGNRPVVIATEDLSGHMPGRMGVRSYAAAPALMAALERAALTRLGPDAQLTFCFSTRAADPWIESLWWQHLRSTRLETSLDDYRTEAREAAGLDRIVARVAAAVRAPVVSRPLEELSRLPDGPAALVLDLLDLPPGLRGAPQPPRNARPDLRLEPVFLELNRSGLPDDAVSATKQKLLRLARRGAE